MVTKDWNWTHSWRHTPTEVAQHISETFFKKKRPVRPVQEEMQSHHDSLGCCWSKDSEENNTCVYVWVNIVDTAWFSCCPGCRSMILFYGEFLWGQSLFAVLQYNLPQVLFHYLVLAGTRDWNLGSFWWSFRIKKLVCLSAPWRAKHCSTDRHVIATSLGIISHHLKIIMVHYHHPFRWVCSRSVVKYVGYWVIPYFSASVKLQ